MLMIRSAQLKQLELPQWEALEREIIVCLREEFTAAASDYDDCSLAGFVNRAVGTARKYGLRRQVDFLSFAALGLSYGENFHLHPTLSWILADPGVPGDRKIPFLLSETLPSQWEQIARDAAAGRRGLIP